MTRSFKSSAALALGVAAFLAESLALGQITEPNGIEVPVPSTNGEVSLQQYFTAQGEMIDSVRQANAEPGAFSPLCDFTAKLVMSESMGASGLAWYNVPTNPNVAPTPLYPLLPPSARVTGQTFMGSDIRQSPNYAGGLIGFALTDMAGLPVYYSEYRRNPNCTGCTGLGPTGAQQMPGYWKMMLAYPSTMLRSSYYLGFEDWPRADDTSWQDNDGDFQDKVFLITGVSCPGGGEPCDTGKQGLCAAGLTECSFDGKPACKAQVTPQPERCDNIDNDCNGTVDDGDLCPTDLIRVRGKCVNRCSTSEFACVLPLVCGTDGFCIDPACKDLMCPAGAACRGGKCVGECQDVVCPIGQICRQDRCIDPCSGVSCPEKTFCNRGVCVGDCSCSPCPAGQECASDGRCVTPGCAAISCPAGQACKTGQCTPACEGAKCPGGASCQDGACADPVSTGGGGGVDGGAGTAGSSGGVVIQTSGGRSDGGSGGSAVSGSTASGGAPASGGVGGGLGSRAAGSDSSSCACRAAAASERGDIAAWLAPLLFGLSAIRRRARCRSRNL